LHGIPYVLDRTNFQPELTLRNAIRHVLACNEKKRQHPAEIVVRLLLVAQSCFLKNRG
jgi:tRNA(Ile)-lysidine synthase TilS/MesJ